MTMTMADVRAADNEMVSPRADRPTRRSFTAEYKLAILAEYEAAEPGAKGALLRREGLYSSHLVEWRRARDAGALGGLAPRPRAAVKSPEQVENERLRRANERLQRELAKTQAALDVVGNLNVGGRLWSREKGRSGAVGRRPATRGAAAMTRVQTRVGCLG
jgi:transposase